MIFLIMFSSRRMCFLNIYFAYFILLGLGLHAEASAKYTKYDGSYYSGPRIGAPNYEKNGLYNNCGANIKITRVTDPQETVINPFYDEFYRSVFFTNAKGGSLFRYDIDKNKTFFTNLVGTNNELQGFVPLNGQRGKFLVNFNDEIGLVTWDGVSPKSTLQIIERPNPYQPWPGFSIVNIAVLDPREGIFFYSRPEVLTVLAAVQQGESSLISINGGKVNKLVDGLTFGNGFALIDGIIYFTDAFSKVMYTAMYNPGENSLGGMEIFINYTEKQIPGRPQSIAVDKDKNLWITGGLKGNRIMKVDRCTKEIICSIPLPAQTTFDLTFAPNQKDGRINTLYVSTSRVELNSTTVWDGALLRVDNLSAEGNLYPEADYNQIFPAKARLE